MGQRRTGFGLRVRRPAAARNGPTANAATLAGEQARHVMLLLNPIGQPREFVVPELVRTIHWRQFINTAADSPHDIFPNLDGPEPPLTGPIRLAERSLLCYVASG